jgi:tRNA dimethylallyltransferase
MPSPAGPGAPRFLAVVGPTGSGKTALSLALGRALDGEVVSMDSRQIYRGMDVGTGKVSLMDRARLPHHGLDLRDPDEAYSAGLFARDAVRTMEEIRGRGRTPLLVGGTGFFLKALMEPMFSEPEMDGNRLRLVRSYLNDLPLERLASYVRVLDPERAEVAVEGGRQRMTRTVEMALLTGRPLTWWHREAPPVRKPVSGGVVLLDPPRDVLYERINQRVGRMVEEGLEEEVRKLLRAGFRRDDPGMTGAGYREMVAHLEGQLTLEEATERIRRSHRRYARRQITWFRHQLPPWTLTADPREKRADLVKRIGDYWNRTLAGGAVCAGESGRTGVE